MDAGKYGVDFGLMVGNARILQNNKVSQNMGVAGKQMSCQTLFKLDSNRPEPKLFGTNRLVAAERKLKKPFVKRRPLDDKTFSGRLLFGEIH